MSESPHEAALNYVTGMLLLTQDQSRLLGRLKLPHGCLDALIKQAKIIYGLDDLKVTKKMIYSRALHHRRFAASSRLPTDTEMIAPDTYIQPPDTDVLTDPIQSPYSSDNKSVEYPCDDDANIMVTGTENDDDNIIDFHFCGLNTDDQFEPTNIEMLAPVTSTHPPPSTEFFAPFDVDVTPQNQETIPSDPGQVLTTGCSSYVIDPSSSSV